MLYDDDEKVQDEEVDDPNRDQARRAQETTVESDPEPIGAEAPPTEDAATDPDPSRDQARRAQEATEDPDSDNDPPQPDGDSLEVVTTGPEDGRIGQGRRGRTKPNRHTGGMSPDDPFWTFGTPQETWGSTRGAGAAENARTHRPRMFLECRYCGVKIEQKRAHGRGRVPCPMCGRAMRQSRQD